MIRHTAVWGVFVLLLLSACNNNAPPTDAAPPTEAAVVVLSTPVPTPIPPTPTPSPIPPSPTPVEPMAARVNGRPIFLADYEKELSRYQQAEAGLGGGEENPGQIVLDALIERELILQAAEAAGLTVSETAVDAKLAELKSASDFAGWLQANLWTEEEFREALAAEMLVEEMAAQATADVPYAVEQAHARYLQVDDLALAQSLLAELQAGADFAFLAEVNSLDKVTAQKGGDLNFFTRWSLLVPEVAAAAFALQPGQVSEIITATADDGSETYYIVQTIEIDPQRPLSFNMRYTLLNQTFEEWLTMQWEQAEIERLVN